MAALLTSENRTAVAGTAGGPEVASAIPDWRHTLSYGLGIPVWVGFGVVAVLGPAPWRVATALQPRYRYEQKLRANLQAALLVVTSDTEWAALAAVCPFGQLGAILQADGTLRAVTGRPSSVPAPRSPAANERERIRRLMQRPTPQQL